MEKKREDFAGDIASRRILLQAVGRCIFAVKQNFIDNALVSKFSSAYCLN
jgi:hypothetical protein